MGNKLSIKWASMSYRQGVYNSIVTVELARRFGTTIKNLNTRVGGNGAESKEEGLK
jgi:hypothetical protein